MLYNLNLNNHKYWTILAVSLLTGSMATACSFNISTAGLKNVKMCPNLVQGQQCANDASTFAQNTPKLFVTADLNNAPEGTKVKIDWRYLGGEAGGETNIDTVIVESKSDTKQITSSLTSSNGTWAKGKYEVVLSLDTDNSKPIRKEFTIASSR
jgi:hypothetical protein